MTKAKRHYKTCPFGVILIPLLFLPCPLNVVGQLEQKHDGAEDTFVARHREAERKNPNGVSFTLRGGAGFSEVKAFLEGKGMKLEKRNGQ